MIMNTKLIMTTVVITVGIVLLASVSPILIGYGDPDSTKLNDGPLFALVGDDGTEHTVIISAGSDSYSISTDGASAKLPTLATYNPGGQYTAPYLALGVYEAYNDSGVLVSQSGRTPTASQNVDTFRSQALANNAGNNNGTYQLWNWYQYTLYKEMATVIMGNSDSQYMMGAGVSSATGAATTGQTSAAYEASTSGTDSVCLLLENAYGSLWEFVGDTSVANYILKTGNALGGNSIVKNQVENTMAVQVSIPASASNSFIATVSQAAESWGVPLTVTTSAGTAGTGINDAMWSSTKADTNNVVLVGGHWDTGSGVGVSALNAINSLGTSYASRGARLAYLITDAGAASAPSTSDWGYVLTMASDGTVSDVQVLKDGTLTSTMPSGTTLNDFWSFDTATGVGPFGAYYAAINLASGSNADDGTEARLSTDKGAVAYILNPSDLHKTLAGNEFDATLYNIMLIIPTVYTYADGDKLYLGSSADTFSGIEMTAYAHAYTDDPDVITGSPVATASTSVVFGDGAIVRLYSTGDVRLITSSTTVNLGQVSADNSVTLKITDSTLSYTDSSGAAGTASGVLAYLSSTGEMALRANPYVTETSTVIIGGITHNLISTDGDTVTIGYTATGKIGELSSVTVLSPTSKDGNKVSSTAVDVNLSTQISNLKRVDSVLFDTTWSDGGQTTATYTYFLAPAEVAYDNPSYVEHGAALISACIVMVIIAILMLAVRATVHRDDD